MKRSIIVFLLLVLAILLCAFALPGHKILYPIKNDGYYGYMNANKKLIVEAKYLVAAPSSEGLAFAMIEKGLFDCLNSRGEVVFSIEADSTRDYKEGLAAFKKDAKWGFVDKKGNIVIEPQYRYAASFSEGFVKVNGFDEDVEDVNASSFYINKNNEMVFDEKFYACMTFSEGYGVVGKWVGGMIHSKYGIIDHNGNIVVPIENRRVMGEVSDGLYGVGVFPESMPPDGTIEEWMGWSFVDIVTGEVKFEWPNSGVGYPHNGYLSAGFGVEDYSSASFGYEGNGIINTKGETVVAPQFHSISEIPSEGLYKVNKRGKSGYMTPLGEIVIPLQFNQTSLFHGKLARIKKDGQWGYVDLNGEIIYDKDVFSSE